MLHFSLHARRDLWLFYDWEEARALWDRFAAVPGLHHLCLMPDHVHLFVSEADPARLRAAMSGFTRWLAHRRGEPGLELWAGVGEPRRVPNREHLERTRRYVLLNPCRGGLVADPLAWPFSTHRDAVGLAWPRARPPVADAAAFHAAVSSDRTVAPAGTDLPARNLADPSYEDVVQAVSAVTRVPLRSLGVDRRTRPLLARCLRCLTDLSARAIARRLGCAPSTVARVEPRRDPVVLVVERVIGDPRFPGLASGDLRRAEAGRRYLAYVAARRAARRRPDEP